jgi:hypothetical protein
MKRNKLFTMAAITLVMSLTGCNKDNGVENTSTEKFKVTLSFKNVATRADGTIAVAGTTVNIIDGYLCFVSPINAITDVYTISSGPTSGHNINNGTLGTIPVTINDVPGTSAKAYMIINTGSLTAFPAVGADINSYLSNDMDVKDQSEYVKVTSSGSATLQPTAQSNVKAADIILSTKVSRIQIEDICFDGPITGTVAGIFINGYYPTMEINGTPGTFVSSTTAANYVDNSNIFPSTLRNFVYDVVDKSINTTVTPNNDVWGYNLFASATPQIIIKLTDVVVDGQILTDDQFVTINGFKYGSTAIANIEGGMIYTIKAGSLVLKYENMGVDPGVTPINVDVTVTTVAWQETLVTPNL